MLSIGKIMVSVTDVYDRYHRTLTDSPLLIVEGMIQKRSAVTNILLHRVSPMQSVSIN